jgi:hypothetical protein
MSSAEFLCGGQYISRSQLPSPALCPRIAAPDTGISAALPRDHNNPLIQVIWQLCFPAIAGVILDGMAGVSSIKDRPVGE